MSKLTRNEYQPNVVSPPGETLQETLEALGISQADLADRTGRSKKTINEIIKGKAPITPKMSIELERVLGVPGGFWNSRERYYREFIARRDENESLENESAWLSKIPVKAMAKLGWIKKERKKVPQVQSILNFLGIATPSQWSAIANTLAGTTRFRKSKAFEADTAALICWLRKGQIDARQLECRPYGADRFLRALIEIRELTIEHPEVFQPEMIRKCAEGGVAVVFTPGLPKTGVSGATRWISPEKALIQLSLRYKTDDHLWFSFFHEAGHILKHGKREVFIEGADVDSDEAKEEEANTFAADFMIPRKDYRRINSLDHYSKSLISQFAHDLHISPGIVVGRLQHDKLLPMSHCNDLKRRFEWVIDKNEDQIADSRECEVS